MSSGVPVLGDGLLSLEGVLCPHSLGVDELALPGLDVAVQVRDQLVFLVAHSRTEVSDAHVRLLGPPSGEGRARNTLRMELHFTQTQIDGLTSHLLGVAQVTIKRPVTRQQPSWLSAKPSLLTVAHF